MGSSRASTPAGRSRTAARRGAGGTSRRSAAKHPRQQPTPKKAAKRAPKRASPKSRKAPPKPKHARKPAPKRTSVPLKDRLPRLLVIAAAVLALLAAGYMLWFRSSSLVAVENVTVTGISGPEAQRARVALTGAAGEMTTLNVDEDALRAAVGGLPTVVGVEADAGFPHDLTITVTERPPVLLARSGEEATPVAGDGTVLTGVEPGSAKLPSIAVDDLPANGKLTGGPLEVALVMGAAPVPLRDLVEDVSIGPPEGVQVTLRGDIPLYFGGAERAADKWAAAAAVLADPKTDTLTYVDLRVPARPAIGGAAPPVLEDTTDATEPETGPGATAMP